MRWTRSPPQQDEARDLGAGLWVGYSTYWSGVTTKSSGSFTPVEWFGQ
jgi:hypothetical protein